MHGTFKMTKVLPQSVRAGQADCGGAEDPPRHLGYPGTDERRGARQRSHLRRVHAGVTADSIPPKIRSAPERKC